MARVAKTKTASVEKKTKVVTPASKKAESKTGKSVVTATKVEATLTVTMKDMTGKAAGTMQLPKDLFEATVNPALMAQAVRVYLANQRRGTHATKTRGEVHGSSRKIYRQKGTGRARHGSIRAPIFVHGGIVFGPKPRDYSLSLPQKMRRKALVSALTAKRLDGKITVVAGLANTQPKTKGMAQAFEAWGFDPKKHSVLLVLGKGSFDNAKRAARNLANVSILPMTQLNTYEVLRADTIVFASEALEMTGKEA